MYFMLQIPVQDSTLTKRKRLYYFLLIPALCSMSGRIQEYNYESTEIY
jgi:hypothetical protein